MSAAAVRAMGEIARRHGMQALIAPVRPSCREPDRSAGTTTARSESSQPVLT
jgi:hypothetical protein